jgi:hypothetical protein
VRELLTGPANLALFLKREIKGAGGPPLKVKMKKSQCMKQKKSKPQTAPNDRAEIVTQKVQNEDRLKLASISGSAGDPLQNQQPCPKKFGARIPPKRIEKKCKMKIASNCKE